MCENLCVFYDPLITKRLQTNIWKVSDPQVQQLHTPAAYQLCGILRNAHQLSSVRSLQRVNAWMHNKNCREAFSLGSHKLLCPTLKYPTASLTLMWFTAQRKYRPREIHCGIFLKKGWRPHTHTWPSLMLSQSVFKLKDMLVCICWFYVGLHDEAALTGANLCFHSSMLSVVYIVCWHLCGSLHGIHNELC